jgi:hypothetical protein
MRLKYRPFLSLDNLNGTFAMIDGFQVIELHFIVVTRIFGGNNVTFDK